MQILRNAKAFIPAALIGYVLMAVFYTQQVVSKQIAFGADYSASQQAATYLYNFLGLAPAYGAVSIIGMALGFFIASKVKKVLVPLAPVAYPMGGAAAVYTVIWLIDHTAGAGGVGAIGGARDALGLSLQCLGGFVAGVIFEWLRAKN